MYVCGYVIDVSRFQKLVESMTIHENKMLPEKSE